MNHKQYLSVVKYWGGTSDECWAVDYNSPSVGMTIKIEKEKENADAIFEKLLNMSDEILEDVLIRHGRREIVII